MAAELALDAIVCGRVQGVFFRAFVVEQARALSLTGYVRNLPGGRMVEVHAEGERSSLEELLAQLKVGPPGARVEKVEVKWSESRETFSCFTIEY